MARIRPEQAEALRLGIQTVPAALIPGGPPRAGAVPRPALRQGVEAGLASGGPSEGAGAP